MGGRARCVLNSDRAVLEILTPQTSIYTSVSAFMLSIDRGNYHLQRYTYVAICTRCPVHKAFKNNMLRPAVLLNLDKSLAIFRGDSGIKCTLLLTCFGTFNMKLSYTHATLATVASAFLVIDTANGAALRKAAKLTARTVKIFEAENLRNTHQPACCQSLPIPADTLGVSQAEINCGPALPCPAFDVKD